MTKRLTIIQGDLTLLPLQQGAIINPSNTGLILTSRGISQSIVRRAGPFIQQSLHTERSKLKGGRLEPGHVLATTAGQLPVDHLIHVAIVGARKVNKRLISRGLLNAYDLANELECRQIGIPPLGPGISKFPMEDFMDMFWTITAEEFPTFKHVQELFLCLDNEEDFEFATNYAEVHVEEMDEDIELVVSEDGIDLSMFTAQFS